MEGLLAELPVCLAGAREGRRLLRRPWERHYYHDYSYCYYYYYYYYCYYYY